ncbi:hypothetical protein [Saccharibacillus sacchari]|uniref:Uncharacterized protein n=1 Tax=Saccharibacillus sacchari TaxID=456493 RepID=A0ACC6PI42_9BACL
MTENKISTASLDGIEGIVFGLHDVGIDPEAIGAVVVSLRRMWQWSMQATKLLDRLEAQYVIPFTLDEPELPQRLLDAIESGRITLNKARAGAGLPPYDPPTTKIEFEGEEE